MPGLWPSPPACQRPWVRAPSRLSLGSSHTIMTQRLGVVARAGRSGRDAMDIIFNVIREDTFWKILLFSHFLMAVSLLAAVTLQAVAVLMPVRQVAGNFIDRSPVPATSYTPLIVVL